VTAGGPVVRPVPERSDEDAARAMVRGYLDHLEEREHVEGVFALLGSDGVLALLADVVARGDAAEVADAGLFVRDVHLMMAPPGFRRAFAGSDLVRALQARLRDPSPRVRGTCLYTLGRTCHRPSARHLDAVFPWYLQNAPLELHRLLPELFWLGGAGRSYAHHLRRLVAAPLYLTRWAAVPLDEPDQRLLGYEKQAVRRLAQDPHPWVRDEARWVLDVRRGGPPHRGRQAYLQRRAAGRPYPTFSALDLAVGHYLGVSGEDSYDAALCTEVGQRMRAEPVRAGYDRAEYRRPLAESRRS
jgi:hypothetical protein